MATSDDDITRFLHSLALSDSVFEVVASSNKVRCLLTSHELPYDLTSVQQYTATKKFKRLYTKLTERGTSKFKKYEHLFIPSRRSSSRLYCPLTRKEVNKLPHELEKYVTGIKFQKALRKKEEAEENEAAAEKATNEVEEDVAEEPNEIEINHDGGDQNDDDNGDENGDDEGGVWVPDGFSSDEEQETPSVDSAVESVPQTNDSDPLLLGEENIDPVPQVKGKSKSKGKKKRKLTTENGEEVINPVLPVEEKSKSKGKKKRKLTAENVEEVINPVLQVEEKSKGKKKRKLTTENVEEVINPVLQVEEKSKGKKKRKIPAENGEEVNSTKKKKNIGNGEEVDSIKKKKKKKLVKMDD